MDRFYIGGITLGVAKLLTVGGFFIWMIIDWFLIRNAAAAKNTAAIRILATYEDAYGEPPSAPYWAHSYDATTLLLEAIKAASQVTDGTLVIDRAKVREHLNAVSGYSGITGTISCDSFGDCGAQKITVIHHLDADDLEISRANIVFEFAP